MKYFNLYILLVAGLALSAQAQMPDFLQKAQDAFSGVKQKMMDKLFNNESFAKVNASVRAVLQSGNLSSLDATTTGNLPTKVWQAVGIGPILTLGKEKVNNLITYGKITSSSMKAELENYIEANVTKDEAITKLAALFRSQTDDPGSLEEGSQARINLLLKRLEAPENWMVGDIKNMTRVLFYLPMDMLQKIQDEAAIRELNRQVILCIRNGNGTSDPKALSCPSTEESKGQTDNIKSRRMTGLKAWLAVKVYGNPSSWTNATFAMMDVESMPVSLLAQMPGNVLISKKQEIVNMMNGNNEVGRRKRVLVGRDIVEKFMMVENVMAMTAVQVMAFRVTLGTYLSQMVYSTDVSTEALVSAQLSSALKINDVNAIKSGNLDAEMVKSMIQDWAAQGNVTAAQARDAGMTVFSLAPAATLGATVKLMNPTKQEMKDITEGIAATGGPGAKEKLRAISTSIFSVAKTSGGLDLAVIPKDMYDLISLSDLKTMDKNSAKSILNDMPASVQPAQISTLISRLGVSERSSLEANAKASMSMSQAKTAIDSLGATSAASLAVGMPASSPLGMMVAAETFGKQSTLSVKSKESLVPFIGVAEAMKADSSNIMEILKDMGSAQPTRDACFVLKDKFVNFTITTMETEGEEEAFELLTTADIEMMPPCVVAAFGKDRLMSMSPDMKIALYIKVVGLGEGLFTGNGLARNMAEMIINEGFMALNKPPQLTGVDVEDMGVALLLTPPNYLDSISVDAAPEAIEVFNEFAATPIMPCLDGSRMEAIRNLIFKSMGSNPSEWMDISSICCLLYTLSGSDINNIPNGALSTCTCDMMDENLYKSEASNKEMMCGGMLSAEMSAKANVKDAQMRAVLSMIDPANLPAQSSRKKRAISELSICDRAVNGVDAITQGEINAITIDDLNTCLSSLGSKYMDSIKAAALAYKVTLSVEPKIYSSLSAKNMTDMGFILRGISDTDIPNLPALPTPDFDNVVMRLGQPDLMLSTEQLNAYAKKVVETWKKPVSTWTAQDIAAVNRLICGMNAGNISLFTTTSFRDAVPFVEVAVTGCDMQTTIMPLAKKAAEVYGDAATWKKAHVREMGQLFAGLEPDTVAKVNGEAAAGITPGAVSILPMSVTAEMTTSQIINMEANSARLFSPEQKSNFSPEMQAALEVTLSRSEGGAASVLVSAVLVSCASVLAFLL